MADAADMALEVDRLVSRAVRLGEILKNVPPEGIPLSEVMAELDKVGPHYMGAAAGLPCMGARDTRCHPDEGMCACFDRIDGLA